MNKNKEHILATIQSSSGSPKYITEKTGISRSNVHKYLRELLDEGCLEKVGSPPAVYYKVIDNFSLIIHNNFILKDVIGHIYRGLVGFKKWVEDKYPDQTLAEKIRIYEESFKLYEAGKQDGFFEITIGLESLKKYTDIYVDKLFCIDLYNLKVGVSTKRTKSAVLLEMAKNSNNRKAGEFVTELCDLTTDKIINHIREKNIPCVAFVSPTAKRSVQIMKELEARVKAKCPMIDYLKIKRFNPSGSMSEQKTIGTVKGRIENARHTFDLTSATKWDTVLLIDDLVGSAATLNEVAKKIKQKGIAKTVDAISLVGVDSKKFPVVKKM